MGELVTNLDPLGNLEAKDVYYVGNVFVYTRVVDPASANKTAVTALALQQYNLLNGQG